MAHVLIAGKIHPSGLALIRSAPGITFDYVEAMDVASFAARMPQAEALVIRTQRLAEATIALAPALRLVSRHGVGYDAVDVPALDRRGIPLCIVGDVNSVSVAEHAMMLMLAAAKQAMRSGRAVRGGAGAWDWRNRMEGVELAGKTLLILGFGRIGQRLARLAAAFGMNVQAHDPVLAAKGWPESPARPAGSLGAAMAAADVVSLNLPSAGRPVLGAAEIGALKPGCIVVNTARGDLIDEAALAAALRSGHVAAAGLDVFGAEPPASDHPLAALDNAILTPHTAGLTRESAERMAVASVQNVLDFLAGRLDPALIVNGKATA